MSAAEKEAAAQPAFDVDAIRAHVQMLHGLAKGVDGVLVVTVLYANGGSGPITHHRVGDVEGMVASTMAHATTPGANCYTGLQLMHPTLDRGKRGGKADIVAVLGLVADQDADTGMVGAMPVDPSYVVESSPGNAQCAVLFDKPVSPNEAAPLAAALHRATGTDSGTKDIAKVWRIAGTLNWPGETKLKRGRSPDPVAVTYIEPFQGVVYTTGDLEAVLADHMKPATPEAEAVAFGGRVNTAELWVRATDLARLKLEADGQPIVLCMPQELLSS